MRRNRVITAVAGVTALLAICAGGWSQTRPPLRPLPSGVTEITGISADGGIVERKDGTLMLAQGAGINDGPKNAASYRLSTDGGKTWSAPQPLNSEVGVGGMIRLKSGALAIYGRKNAKGANTWEYYFSKSTDEGTTWSPGVLITNYPSFYPMYHSLIQLDSGRLLLTGYWEGLDAAPPDVERYTRGGWGFWRGKVLFMEGHRGVEMSINLTFYSDDEGQTWKQCEGGVFGWFDEYGDPNGAGGILDLSEPTSAATKDGRVLMMSRSKTGRLVQCYSLNDGKTWYSAQPTELSSSQSPPLLIRVPSTGDFLCVWNQVSAEEIRRGLLRGRLSAAISKDSGATWQNFKTLELQQGMQDIDRIPLEFPISRRLVARPGIGQLPDGFAMFTYSNVDIIGEKVFVRYVRMWPRVLDGQASHRDTNLPLMWPKWEEREAEMTGEGVLRVYPLAWFYQ
jgi:hypothetical protein